MTTWTSKLSHLRASRDGHSLLSSTYVVPGLIGADTRSHHRPRKAFTLIELLVVMMIIAILMGLVLGIWKYAQMAALRGKTRSQIEKLHNALMEYNMKYGKYPPEATWFSDVRPWLPDTFAINRDAWGTAFTYDLESANTYNLFSAGPDTNNGTGDDIATGK